MTGNEPDAKAILPKRGASRKQIPISQIPISKVMPDDFDAKAILPEPRERPESKFLAVSVKQRR